jgi:hypothetical protein
MRHGIVKGGFHHLEDPLQQPLCERIPGIVESRIWESLLN